MTRTVLFLLVQLAIRKESESYRIDRDVIAKEKTAATLTCENTRCKVSGLKSDDVLAKLGLQNGDIVTNAEGAKQLLEHARTNAQTIVKLERGGQQFSLYWYAPAKPLTDAELEQAVKKSDDAHYVLDRKLWERILSDNTTLMTQARIVPNIKDGRAHGFKLFAIRPGSVYARLGIVNGDTVLALNGHDMSSPEKALEVYSKLRTAKELVVELDRKGSPLTIHYEVR
jgi:type II secretory pathway component PulC